MTKLEALEGSVKKWEGICLDAVAAAEAMDHCTLCEYDGEHGDPYGPDCIHCPLAEVGQQCGVPSSRWGIIRKKLGDYRSRNNILTLSEYNDKTLTALCHTMRDLLIRLRDEEKRSDSG